MRFKKDIVKVGNQFYTVVQFNYTPPKDKKVLQNRMHFIQILDRSGSMSSHINELIENVKRTLDVMQDNDLLSIIWFSGPGQCKVLLKGASPKDPNLGKQLDTLKSTIGITCFSEAVMEGKNIVADLYSLCENFIVSLFTDGQPVVPWSEKEEENRTKQIVNDISNKIISFNTIGYGGYYNINFLKELAALSKFGRHAHSTKINEYLPIFTHNLKSVEDITSVTIEVSSPMTNIVYFTSKTSRLEKNNLKVNLSSKSDNKFFILGPSTEDFQFEINGAVYNSSKIKNKLTDKDVESLLYVMAYEQYYKGNTSDALKIISESLMDKYLTKTALDAFTAKERQNCTNYLFAAAHNKKINLGHRVWPRVRFLEGKLSKDESINNAVCFMDLLEVFESNNDRFIPVSSEKYKRIGKKVVDNYNAFKIDKTIKLSASFRDLVFTKEKLNISIRYEIPGFVTINPRQAKSVGFDTNVFKSKIYREQTIIKDGDINIDKFEILATNDTLDFLKKFNINNLYNVIEQEGYQYEGYTLIEIDISKIPVLSRNYVMQSDSLDFILDTYYEQRVAECKQKVTKYFIDIESKKMGYSNAKYTKEQSDLLKSFGIDSNGIYTGIDNKIISQVNDQYECKFFEFALKGFSNLPKVEEVFGKINGNKKLNAPETIMCDHIRYLKENNMLSSIELLSKILESQKTIIRNNTRILAQIKLAKALTGGWWQGLKIDAKGNYIYERDDKTLIIKVIKKLVNI